MLIIGELVGGEQWLPAQCFYKPKISKKVYRFFRR